VPKEKQSLVEKARAINLIRKHKTVYSEEEKELALAWVNDEVGMAQIARALGTEYSQSYIFLSKCLKQIIRETIDAPNSKR